MAAVNNINFLENGLLQNFLGGICSAIKLNKLKKIDEELFMIDMRIRLYSKYYPGFSAIFQFLFHFRFSQPLKTHLGVYRYV